MIPKPKTDTNGKTIESIDSYSRRLTRLSMPTGATKRKTPKAGRWRKDAQTKKKNGKAAEFNLKGPCYGCPVEVSNLAVNLAEEALNRGDKELAQRVLVRLEKYHKELKLKAEIARLEKGLA